MAINYVHEYLKKGSKVKLVAMMLNVTCVLFKKTNKQNQKKNTSKQPIFKICSPLY